MYPPFTRLAAQFVSPRPDGELLARFVRERDEAAFVALVHRHGSAVYGVCRRLLGNSADADDAFQTVFLVLVNRADALTHLPALGGWLHEVAVRVARKARTAFARLRKHELRAAKARTELVFDPPPGGPPTWLDGELAALPARYREPVIMCLVQERPRAEVAAELGIPEGTLASRLDTARKRLAGRLARHRLPLAFAGLLVPVPAELAAAAANRVADVAGVAIHRLANEVTKTMFSNTKWATALTVLALAAVGGVLLAAGGGVPPAARPVDRADVRWADPVPAKQELLEPAWLTAFRKTYELKEGEYVKRVPPPYIAERVDFQLQHIAVGEKVDGAVEEKNRKLVNENGMFSMLFVEQNGRKLNMRRAISAAYLKDCPEKQRGNNLLTVQGTIGCLTGLAAPEVILDPKSKGKALFAEGNPTVHGDFVTRRGAPLGKLVPQLEKILREECKLDVRLTLREEEQPVFVVGGAFKPNPPQWRPKKELDIYATDEGLNKEYDHFDFENRQGKKFETVESNQYEGSAVDLVRFVGYRLRTRMVWDTPLSPEPRVIWHNHTIRNPTKEEAATDHDPEKLLKVVSEQTGLTFKQEKRKAEVLYLSAAEQK